jgi:hypothetical protein
MDVTTEKQKFVFISHSNAPNDAKITDELYKFLVDNQVCCWYDKNIISGEWPAQIYTHLIKSSVCILVASKNSLTSKEVKGEMDLCDQIGNMRKSGKIIIPFAIDDYIDAIDEGKGSIGYYMGDNRNQAVYLSRYPDMEAAFRRVLQLVDSIPGGISRLKNNPADFFYNADGSVLMKYVGNDSFVEVPCYVEEIGEKAFQGCEGIHSIIIPKTVKKISSFAFLGCTNLCNVEGMEGVNECCSNIFQGTKLKFDNENNYGINGVVVGGKVGSDQLVIDNTAKTIADKAFILGEFKSIILPEGLENIGQSAFAACMQITSVVIPSTIKRIGKNAFKDCFSLKDVIFNGKLPVGYEQAFDNLNIIKTREKDEE